ncbi:MAG: hypothetical protein IIZ12_00435, partial [Eggerthellaceae bacterium]|nr:hypothetical protein [Eggerthellaceae bacterium]
MEKSTASKGTRKLAAAAIFALCLAVVLGIAGCGSSTSSSTNASSASASSETVQFTDSAGRTVEVPANIERVAITGPISQMCMLTLAPEKLVGLSNELSGAE